MNWGKSIIAAFLFFALFIGVLVFICMKQEVSLVSKDYYKDEINYQQQIERLNNAEHLESKPTISILDADVKVSFKKKLAIENGELSLFRPSDLHLDKKFKFNSSSDSVLNFNASGLPAGMYRAKLMWVMDGKEYYVEQIVNR
jgi:hypothetical protein